MVTRTPAPILPADAHGLAAATAALWRGGLIGLPTETVYGLAGDALRPEVVARLFAAKGRPPDNPLIVHLADDHALGDLVRTVTPLARALIRTYWPGPLTLVLDAAPVVPTVTRGGLSTVAVRVPDHPVAATLLAQSGLALAAPSANLSGRPSPTRAEHVAVGLQGAVDLVLDGGACPVGVESTVVDARGARPVVLRDGFVTREELGAPAASTPAQAHRSPGTRYAHYAPRCAVEIVTSSAALLARARAGAAEGELLGLLADADALAATTSELGAGVVGFQAVVEDEVALARALYGAFLAAEEAGVDRLLVVGVPERGVGRAVMDRLRRAAAAAGARTAPGGR
ncbi:MAG: L-threonylcarbamoyladenylate synthase [Nitriliruptoraceae bacterium]